MPSKHDIKAKNKAFSKAKRSNSKDKNKNEGGLTAGRFVVIFLIVVVAGSAVIEIVQALRR